MTAAGLTQRSRAFRRRFVWKKGGIIMSAIGFLQARAFTSSAQLPLRDVAITITDDDGNAIAMRLTDRSGIIAPVQISVPNRSESQSPGTEEIPYTLVNLFAYRSGYETIQAKHLQIFADTVTYQDLEMIPEPEYPDAEDDTVFYDTPSQNL